MKIFSIVLFAILITISTFADTFEIIQSVPVGTSLEVSGIRHAKDVWPEMISKAKKSIDLEMFYATNDANTANDPVLDNVTNEIIAAAKRGVKVHFIVDSKMYAQKANQVIPKQLVEIKNIEVKVIDFSKIAGGIQHAKFFIIDQKEFFMGSNNYDWRALDQIHEVGMRSDNAIALNGLLSIFKMDWELAAYLQKPIRKKSLKVRYKRVSKKNLDQVQFLASPQKAMPQNITPTIDAFLNQIDKASKSIYLQTYDYGIHLFGKSDEWRNFQDALIKAAKRGIKVQLLVDKKSLKNESPALIELKQNGIEVKAVYIPDLESGPIPYARLVHSKYIIFDDSTAWIGSENLSGSYFLDSRNVGVLFQNVEAVKQLNLIFIQTWNSAYSKEIN